MFIVALLMLGQAATTPDNVEIRCIYDIANVDADAMLSAYFADFKGTDPSIVATVNAVRNAIPLCTKKYDWDESKLLLAEKYLGPQAERVLAPKKLGKYGVTLSFIDAFATGLDEASRQRYLSGKQTPADMLHFVGALQKAFPQLDKLNEQESEAVGAVAGQALVGTIIGQSVARDFNNAR